MTGRGAADFAAGGIGIEAVVRSRFRRTPFGAFPDFAAGGVCVRVGADGRSTLRRTPFRGACFWLLAADKFGPLAKGDAAATVWRLWLFPGVPCAMQKTCKTGDSGVRFACWCVQPRTSMTDGKQQKPIWFRPPWTSTNVQGGFPAPSRPSFPERPDAARYTASGESRKRLVEIILGFRAREGSMCASCTH
jgi:hypothetical protein